MKEEALDRTMWSAGFRRGFGPVVRQATFFFFLLALQPIVGLYFAAL